MQSRQFLFLDLGKQTWIHAGVMIFEFDGGKSVHLEQGLVTEFLFVLRDVETIPYISEMDHVIIGMQREMRENRLAKMHGTRKKVLRKILRNAGDARALDSIFGGEQTVVRRDKMDAVIPIDQSAQVVENMGTCPFWARNDIEGCVENICHFYCVILPATRNRHT